jgi:Cu/Ag efflux pump CusA
LISIGCGTAVKSPIRSSISLASSISSPGTLAYNLKRMVAVTARISGRDMGSTVAEVIKALDQPDMLTHDVYYVLGGLYEQQRIAFHDLIIVFIAAIALC